MVNKRQQEIIAENKIESGKSFRKVVLAFHCYGARATAFVSGLAQVCLLLAWGAFLAGVLCGGWWWVFELFSHYVPYYAGGAALALGWFSAVRRWRWAACAAVLLTVNGALISVWYSPRGVTLPKDAPSFTLLHWNVAQGNSNQRAALDFLLERDPDVICLNEASPQWAETWRALEAKYPFHLVESRYNCTGIAVFSRIPLENIGVLFEDTFGSPAVSATLRVSGNAIRLLALHTLPPFGAKWARTRNLQLDAAAAWANKETAPCIVAGDLNVSMWSPVYRRFMARAGLVNARRGFGVLPTWRSSKHGFLSIPIDHILLGHAIAAASLDTFPPHGSDHAPLMSVLVLLPTQSE